MFFDKYVLDGLNILFCHLLALFQTDIPHYITTKFQLALPNRFHIRPIVALVSIFCVIFLSRPRDPLAFLSTSNC